MHYNYNFPLTATSISTITLITASTIDILMVLGNLLLVPSCRKVIISLYRHPENNQIVFHVPVFFLSFDRLGLMVVGGLVLVAFMTYASEHLAIRSFLRGLESRDGVRGSRGMCFLC